MNPKKRFSSQKRFVIGLVCRVFEGEGNYEGLYRVQLNGDISSGMYNVIRFVVVRLRSIGINTL